MRSVMDNRGAVLRMALLALALTLLAAIVALKAVIVHEPVKAAVEPLRTGDELLTEREAAHALLRSGEVEAGALALLDSLRGLPDDAPELLDTAHGTVQMLAFAMIGLMRDETLERFQPELDPAQWPVDGLVEAYYYREVEDYARWRKMALFSSAQMWGRIEALCASPSALVRAGGLLMAASPYLWTRIAPAEVASMLDATNEFGALLPGSRLLREVVREHVRACLGPGFHPLPDVQALFGALAGGDAAQAAEEAVNADLSEAVPLAHGAMAVGAMADLLPWNSSVQAVLDNDPVVALAQAAAAQALESEPGADEEDVRQACLAVVLDAALNDEDAAVRDWCLRSTVIFDGMLHARASHQEAAAVRDACSQRARALPPPEGLAPVDGARAAVNLLVVAAERGDLSQATADLQALATDTRQTEPIDMNLFEQAPRRLAHYGYALARQGSYEEGAAVFERLAALYPDSLLADKWRDDAAHLREVINRVTR